MFLSQGKKKSYQAEETFCLCKELGCFVLFLLPQCHPRFVSDSNITSLCRPFKTFFSNCLVVLQSEESSPASKHSRKGRRKSAYQVTCWQSKSQCSVVIQRVNSHYFLLLLIQAGWKGVHCRSTGLGESAGIFLVARDGCDLEDQVLSSWHATGGVVWRWNVFRGEMPTT